MPTLASALLLVLWQASVPAEPRDLSALIVPVLIEADLPALGCALVTSSGLAGVGAVGLRSSGGSVEVTPDDQWHLGSCTKALTATLVARMVERGLLRWETTLGEVFGAAPTKMDPAWRDVSITWLLCHRSGASLNFEAELWTRMEALGGSTRAQRRLFVEQGLRVAPEVRPNTATLYSNAGFLLAAAMLEERADQSFEELARREVFEPLGMSHTGFGAPGTAERLDQPLGHTRGKDGWSPVPLGPQADNPAVAGPAGTVHTTLADWARFACAHLRGARGDESYLKQESWQRLHTPLGDGATYSPGWVVSEADWASGTLLSHLGSNQHWVAEISLAPRLDVAVLVVTNVGDDAAEPAFRHLREALVADHLAHAK